MTQTPKWSTNMHKNKTYDAKHCPKSEEVCQRERHAVCSPVYEMYVTHACRYVCTCIYQYSCFASICKHFDLSIDTYASMFNMLGPHVHPTARGHIHTYMRTYNIQELFSALHPVMLLSNAARVYIFVRTYTHIHTFMYLGSPSSDAVEGRRTGLFGRRPGSLRMRVCMYICMYV
jgi:hypothetical protein